MHVKDRPRNDMCSDELLKLSRITPAKATQPGWNRGWSIFTRFVVRVLDAVSGDGDREPFGVMVLTITNIAQYRHQRERQCQDDTFYCDVKGWNHVALRMATGCRPRVDYAIMES